MCVCGGGDPGVFFAVCFLGIDVFYSITEGRTDLLREAIGSNCF